MTVFVKQLTWDTQFFGYKIGQLSNSNLNDLAGITSAFRLAIKQGYRLIYLNSYKELEALSELTGNAKINAKILLVDKKVTYTQFLIDDFPPDSYSNIELYTSNIVTPKLFDISLQSGLYSRFAVDPNFSNREFERLYTEWIKKSVSGEIAKEVWVSRNQNGEISGLITLGIKNSIPDIGLLAVDASSRGKNLGARLVKIAKMRAREWGSNKLQVVTQLDNSNACRFYEKCGFQIKNIEYIYHIWF